MAVPSLRALEGRLLRKSRTDLDLAEKGLTLVETSVMKRVIILFEWCSMVLSAGGRRSRVRCAERLCDCGGWKLRAEVYSNS